MNKASTYVTFEEFKRLDIRVARVIKVEKIPGSRNLLKITIDIGGEERTIVAGIAKYYEPESLIGKNIVVIVNLEPKKIFGVLSQGMLLAADLDGEPVLLTTDKPVPPGTKVR